jgi:hypothetical protein
MHEVLGEEMMDDDGKHMYEKRWCAEEPLHIDFERDSHQWQARMIRLRSPSSMGFYNRKNF